MYRDKTVTVLLSVLMLLILVEPVLAVPAADSTIASQEAIEGISPTLNPTNTEATTTPELQQAFAEVSMAVKQTQAEKIRQELDRLGEELERLNTDYMAESAKLASLEESVVEARQRVHWFEAELEAERQILNDRVANIYKHGEVKPLDALITNTSLSQMYARLSMLMRISEQDADLLDKLREQKTKVETAKSALDQLFEQQKAITADLESKKTEIEVKIQQEAAILQSIDTETQAILDEEKAREQREQVQLVNNMLRTSQPMVDSQTNTPQPNRTNKFDKIALKPGTIAFEAIQYLGVPYVWGGENPRIGLDCSGLVLVVFREFGVNLPHYSRAQAKLGAPVSYNNLQSGDLVFFGSPIHHVGIYIGEGYYIHAPKRNDVVKISKMNDRRDHAGARRIISVLPSE